jgi:hypothetical protein
VAADHTRRPAVAATGQALPAWSPARPIPQESTGSPLRQAAHRHKPLEAPTYFTSTSAGACGQVATAAVAAGGDADRYQAKARELAGHCAAAGITVTLAPAPPRARHRAGQRRRQPGDHPQVAWAREPPDHRPVRFQSDAAADAELRARRRRVATSAQAEPHLAADPFARRCSPLQGPRRGWVPLDRRQVEIHRLMAMFGPAPAAFYADACRLQAGEPSLASTTHLVGHLLRELESALREILRPMIPPQQATSLFAQREEEGHHAREIDAIATALGFPPDDEVRSLWKSLELHRLGHRGSQLRPRPVDDDFRARWDNAQILLMRLGRQFESSFTAALPLIVELAGKEQPTRSDATRLQSVPHSVVALDAFFERAGPGWFPLLRRRGYLHDPPPLEVADDTVAYVRWPAGRNLARMATEPSIRRDVIEVALALETDNPQAHECVAEAALALPAAEGARVAPKLADFLASPYQWALPSKARDLAARLAQAGGRNQCGAAAPTRADGGGDGPWRVVAGRVGARADSRGLPAAWPGRP